MSYLDMMARVGGQWIQIQKATREQRRPHDSSLPLLILFVIVLALVVGAFCAGQIVGR